MGRLHRHLPDLPPAIADERLPGTCVERQQGRQPVRHAIGKVWLDTLDEHLSARIGKTDHPEVPPIEQGGNQQFERRDILALLGHGQGQRYSTVPCLGRQLLLKIASGSEQGDPKGPGQHHPHCYHHTDPQPSQQ